MPDVLETMAGVVHTVKHAFDGQPEAPPPPPTTPPPTTPPLFPPRYPPAPPLIVCPPMAPPPLSPPGFHVWAAQVPPWFWLMFSLMFAVACCGTAAIVYILRELRRQRKGERLPKEETMKSLSQLENRLAKRGF